jgi:outer membrane protein assembly factor BamB
MTRTNCSQGKVKAAPLLLLLFAFFGAGCGTDAFKSQWKKSYKDLSSPMAFTRYGLVFVDKDDNRLNQLTCVSVADGEHKWVTAIKPVALRVGDNVALATDESKETIYLAQGNSIAAFSAETGAQAWSNEAVSDPNIWAEDFYAFTPPVVTDKYVVLTSRWSRVVTLDRQNGRLVWRTNNDRRYADSLVVRVVVVISISYQNEPGEADVAAHDLATGRERWHRRLSGTSEISSRWRDSITYSPPVKGVFLTLDSTRSILALEIATGKLLWSQPVAALASFTVGQGTILIADSSSVRGIDAVTGQLRWQRPSEGMTLVAPLNENEGLIQMSRFTATFEYLTGSITRHFSNAIGEQDKVLAGQKGMVVVTLGQSAKLFISKGGKLAETVISHRSLIPNYNASPRQVVFLGNDLAVYTVGVGIEVFHQPVD